MTTLEIVLVVSIVLNFVAFTVLGNSVFVKKRALTQAESERRDLMQLIFRFSDQALAISEQNLDWMKYQQQPVPTPARPNTIINRPIEPDVSAVFEAPPAFRDGEPGPMG